MNSDGLKPDKAEALAGLSVLVTRPIHQQSSLLESIEMDGARTVSLPVMRIDPVRSARAVQKARSLVQNLDQFQWLIFISTNAASLGADLIEDFWPQFPAGVKVAAIGRSTAAVLIDRLYLPIVTPLQGWDSEKLLSLPEFQDLEGSRIAIFRGVGGRELLASTLEERGAQVQYVELYKRAPVRYSVAEINARLKAGAVNAVVVHSGESLALLVELLQRSNKLEHYQALPLVVPSNRVATEARALGFEQVYDAQGADDSSIKSALREIRQNADINS
ncbi:MAG: uroporphyrinogen-III synthase [Proteobacteria bacterium]|nr:uroporphyrinogen-III synthase [Pseudomonadota bacterium]MDA0927232.1 uroporphyrinogen-III synthase [Pseudomonadota bacterium]